MLITWRRSILGECRGNVRSTPIPNDCLRTVNVSRTPAPWRLMTMPSNTWMRWRWPSITLKCTRTVSPALNRGTSRAWRRSMSEMTLIGERNGRPRNASHRARASQVGPAPGRAAALGRRLSPPRHLGVVARAQHVRYPPPAEPLGPGVVRVFGKAAERLRVGVVLVALALAERALELPGDGVDHGHRRHLAAREDVAADRDLVVCEVVVDALVEALVAAGEQGQPLQPGQLGDDGIGELAADGRQHGHPPRRQDRLHVPAVRGLERRAHHVDPDDHARAAAVRRVVGLAVVAEAELPQVDGAQGERAGRD